MKIGLISDTHGFVDPAILAELRGMDLILHAGDVGTNAVLAELGRLAPLRAVRGNTDRSGRAGELPPSLRLSLEGHDLVLIHDLGRLPRFPPAGADIVVHGHTHRARIEKDGGTLVVNPGSASRPRGGGPSLGLLTLRKGRSEARIVCP